MLIPFCIFYFACFFSYILICRLPDPALPSFTLLPDVLLDAFVITMVSYTITMSMALIFAQKLHYEVDSNQELLAQVSRTRTFVMYTFQLVFLLMYAY